MNSETQVPIIWTISGSDCSGGAGIAADIKTIHSLGGEVCTLITANTSQNSKQLVAINPVSVDILQQQAEALRNDKPPSAIKIGLLANNEQVIWLTELLVELKQQLPDLIVIYDPVASASVGGKFSQLSPSILAKLFPYLTAITPNIDELTALTEVKATVTVIPQLATQLLNQGIGYVVVKGGHSEQETCLDSAFFSEDNGELSSFLLKSPRINTDYSHGTGCVFATSLATLLAQGYLMRDAFTLTKAFINQGLAQQQGKLGYYGAFAIGSFPEQAQYFPTVVTATTPANQFPSLNLNGEKLGLYPVINSLTWLEKLLPLKPSIIQLRLKNMPMAEVEQLIIKAVTLTQHTDTRLFINDYWQLAIKHKAYGVHLGQEDLAIADLAAIAKAGIRLGISTHGCYEFLLAQQLQPSYLAIGAIFPTVTKDMTGQIQGIDNLSHMLKLKADIPVVAIGGINQTRAIDVAATGVDSIAVVTAITRADDYIAATKQLMAICN